MISDSILEFIARYTYGFWVMPTDSCRSSVKFFPPMTVGSFSLFSLTSVVSEIFS